jgi:hypothetical protein
VVLDIHLSAVADQDNLILVGFQDSQNLAVANLDILIPGNHLAELQGNLL